MKKSRLFFQLFVLVIFITLSSCGNKKDILTLILKTDKTEVDAGNREFFTFVITGSDGEYYTKDAEIFVNDEKIIDNKFYPEDAGNFEVYAVYNGITSEKINITAINNLSSINITNQVNDLVGKDVTISIVDNYGNNVEEYADIYVNDQVITGTSYTANSEGKISLYAKYKNITSSTVDINFYDATHTTKILVEDYTGTWCGYCPRVAYKLEQAVDNNSNIIPVAIHDDNDMPYEYVNQMIDKYGIQGFPTAKVNKFYTWGEGEAEFTQFLIPVGLGLSINSTLSGSTMDITIGVHFDITYNKSLELVVYLLEDNLVYDQRNYADFGFGADDPLQDFKHNNVLRKAYTDIFGDKIDVSECVRNNTYTRTFTGVSIPNNVSNSSNIKLVAFVINNNEVVNVQEASVDFNQDFD